MNGLTSAGCSAGGLRVVAEGTIDPIDAVTEEYTVTLPAPADYLLYTTTYSGSNSALATYLIPRNWEGKLAAGRVTLAADGMSIVMYIGSPTQVAITYFALTI